MLTKKPVPTVVLEVHRRHLKSSFHLFVWADGRVRVDGFDFPSTQAAYDYFRPQVQGNHAAWSICYLLEEYVESPKKVYHG